MVIDTVCATLPNTNSQASRSTHSPCARAVPHLQSWEGHPLALGEERLCGCSHVYVWEISNDERMPFQVWARGASVRCPTLSPHALPLTHTHIATHTHRDMCNFVINPLHIVLYSHHMFTTSKDLQDCRSIASKSTPDIDSVVSRGPGS